MKQTNRRVFMMQVALGGTALATQQAKNNDFFAAQLVGSRPKRQLQGPLSEAINTHGQAHEGGVVAPRVMGSL